MITDILGRSLSDRLLVIAYRAEVMAELDLDGSGTIGVSEFLDKLKQVKAESEQRIKQCKALFAEVRF